MIPDGPGDPTVARIGGGRSARLAAVAVVLALGAVVWIGISGRPSTQTVPPTLVAAVAPSPPVVDESPAPTSVASPGLTGPRATPRLAVLPADVFGVSVMIGEDQFIRFLDEAQPGHLTGQAEIPGELPARLPGEETVPAVVFLQLSGPAARGVPVQIGQWPINLDPLQKISGRTDLVIDEYVSASTGPADSPRPVQEGYWIRIGIRAGADKAIVEIDVRIGPDQILLAKDYPRGRGLYNRCRWDVSPYSGRPGSDEASC